MNRITVSVAAALAALAVTLAFSATASASTVTCRFVGVSAPAKDRMSTAGARLYATGFALYCGSGPLTATVCLQRQSGLAWVDAACQTGTSFNASLWGRGTNVVVRAFAQCQPGTYRSRMVAPSELGGAVYLSPTVTDTCLG